MRNAITALNEKTNELKKYINKNNSIENIENHLVFKLNRYIDGIYIEKYKNINKLTKKLKQSKYITCLYVKRLIKLELNKNKEQNYD
jgi:hypothetical protein